MTQKAARSHFTQAVATLLSADVAARLDAVWPAVDAIREQPTYWEEQMGLALAAAATTLPADEAVAQMAAMRLSRVQIDGHIMLAPSEVCRHPMIAPFTFGSLAQCVGDIMLAGRIGRHLCKEQPSLGNLELIERDGVVLFVICRMEFFGAQGTTSVAMLYGIETPFNFGRVSTFSGEALYDVGVALRDAPADDADEVAAVDQARTAASATPTILH